MSPGPPVSRRNVSLDLLRLLLALLVLLSHASELTDGNRSRELLSRLTRGHLSFGSFAVDGFFLISGFLIVQSWLQAPRLARYLRKRILRIVPGYAVAAVLSIVLAGLFAPVEPHFFDHLSRLTALSLLTLSSPVTPLVFAGTKVQLVNGSLWTISYEFRCYLFVALAGLCGLFRWRRLLLGVTFCLLVVRLAPALVATHVLPDFKLGQLVYMLLGNPFEDLRLLSVFLVGICFYLFRDRIIYRRWLALAAALLLVASLAVPVCFEVALNSCGAYLLFFFISRSQLALPAGMRLPDISYGVYLYGWPVEMFLICFLRPSPWIVFGLAVPITMLLGWLSWLLIEQPALRVTAMPRPPPSWPVRSVDIAFGRRSASRPVL